MKHDYLRDVIIRSLTYYIAIERAEIGLREYVTEEHQKNAHERLRVAENYLKEVIGHAQK